MKAQLKVRGNLTIEVEAEQQKDLFRVLAGAQEVFGEKNCGKCKSGDVLFRVRTVKGLEFFELVCGRCRAVLQLGVHREGGTLFPRRHAELEGGVKEWLPDNGWKKWDPEAERMV
jgi:phage FluMu protein Com